jgi:hypothetical protein
LGWSLGARSTDSYYLWMNADWPSFIAKWPALAAKNLRLVGVREYNRLWRVSGEAVPTAIRHSKAF